MVTQLTKNAIDSLINSTNPDEQYVIQILQAPQQVVENLFKIYISDGFCKYKKGYFVSDAAMKCQDLKDLSIIRCKKYIDESNSDKDKERIIISTYDLIYANITEPIGKPIDYKNYKQNNFQNPEGTVQIPPKYLSRNAQVLQQNQAVQPKQITPPSNVNKPAATNNFNNNNNNAQKPPVSNQNMNRVNSNPNQNKVPAGSNNHSNTLTKSTDNDEKDLEPIKSLTPNGGNQSFKARITKKGDLKTFQKEKSGQLFSMDVIDSYGDETTITFFNDQATKFDGQFQVGQVLIFKNFTVKPNTNFQYNKGDNCVTVNKETVILHCTEEDSIPKQKLNKRTISDIQGLQKGDNIDLVVVVKEDSIMKNMTLKNTNNQSKRDMIVFDESTTEIDITLWGDHAKNYDAKKGDIMVLKDAKIGVYKERKQLNIGYGTQVFLNPDVNIFPQVQPLSNWARSLNEEQLGQFVKSGGAFESGNRDVTTFESSLSILKEEITKQSPFDDQTRIFKEVRAQILYIRDTTLYYNGCPTCKKKVNIENETWYCQNSTCNKVLTDGPDSRYILSIHIGDSTDTMWVSAFDEVGVEIFGQKAKIFREADEDKDHGIETKKKLLMAAQNKEFRFLLLTKGERDQNQQMKEKTIIQSVKPNHPVLEAKRILNSVDKYMEILNNQ